MQNPPVSQAVSEETADRLVRGGLLRRAAGRSAPRHGGRLVRQEINRSACAARLLSGDSCPSLTGGSSSQVLREDGLRLHLPDDRDSAGRESRGHAGVQT